MISPGVSEARLGSKVTPSNSSAPHFDRKMNPPKVVAPSSGLKRTSFRASASFPVLEVRPSIGELIPPSSSYQPIVGKGKWVVDESRKRKRPPGGDEPSSDIGPRIFEVEARSQLDRNYPHVVDAETLAKNCMSGIEEVYGNMPHHLALPLHFTNETVSSKLWKAFSLRDETHSFDHTTKMLYQFLASYNQTFLSTRGLIELGKNCQPRMAELEKTTNEAIEERNKLVEEVASLKKERESAESELMKKDEGITSLKDELSTLRGDLELAMGSSAHREENITELEEQNRSMRKTLVAQQNALDAEISVRNATIKSAVKEAERRSFGCGYDKGVMAIFYNIWLEHREIDYAFLGADYLELIAEWEKKERRAEDIPVEVVDGLLTLSNLRELMMG